MKNIILVATAVLLSSVSYAKRLNKNCSLAYFMKPKCYHKRSKPVLKVALINYGETMKLDDLNRISHVLKKRFEKANDNLIQLEIIEKMVLPYKQKLPAKFEYNGIKDKARLHRIWYYENVGASVMSEVYYEYRKASTWKVLNKLDAILVVTGAQFNGLGFASGRVSVTEYPREIAWALPAKGSTEYPSDYSLVDELIHELGHNMFLGHTSTQCQKPGISLEESAKCCKESPSRNDVLSYCRDRTKVNKETLYGFEQCNKNMIKNKIIPAMLNGSRWNISDRTKCL